MATGSAENDIGLDKSGKLKKWCLRNKVKDRFFKSIFIKKSFVSTLHHTDCMYRTFTLFLAYYNASKLGIFRARVPSSGVLPHPVVWTIFLRAS